MRWWTWLEVAGMLLIGSVAFLLLGWLLAGLLAPALALDWFSLRSRLAARVAFLAALPPAAVGLVAGLLTGAVWLAAVAALNPPPALRAGPSAPASPPTAPRSAPAAPTGNATAAPALRTVTPIPPQPSSTPIRTPTPRPATPTPVPLPQNTTPVFYQNCDQARAAGAAPLQRSQPGYRPALDRDGDGIACE